MTQSVFLAMAIVGNVVAVAAMVAGFYWQKQRNHLR